MLCRQVLVAVAVKVDCFSKLREACSRCTCVSPLPSAVVLQVVQQQLPSKACRAMRQACRAMLQTLIQLGN